MAEVAYSSFDDWSMFFILPIDILQSHLVVLQHWS